MKHFSALLSRLHKIKNQHGFTMIELLIVISILGILAVAVLSAINPVEQINRGRDTGSRSDAEQLLSAIDRYNAFQGYFPWQIDVNDSAAGALAVDPITPVTLTDFMVNDPVGAAGCAVLTRLSAGDDAINQCAASQELKESFVTRIDGTARRLYAYNRGTQGDSTYVCFVPQSGAFITEATTRCEDGLPADLQPIANDICNDVDGSSGARTSTDITEGDAPMICLP